MDTAALTWSGLIAVAAAVGLVIVRHFWRRRVRLMKETPLERARRLSRAAGRESARLRGKPVTAADGTLDVSSVSIERWSDVG